MGGSPLMYHLSTDERGLFLLVQRLYASLGREGVGMYRISKVLSIGCFQDVFVPRRIGSSDGREETLGGNCR